MSKWCPVPLYTTHNKDIKALHGSPHFQQPFFRHLHIPQVVTCPSVPRVFLPCAFHFALLWCTNALLAVPCVPASQTETVWHLETPFLLYYTVSCSTERLNRTISITAQISNLCVWRLKNYILSKKPSTKIIYFFTKCMHISSKLLWSEAWDSDLHKDL